MRTKAPKTPATTTLDAAGAAYTPHLYAYEDRGGTAVSARELGVDEHVVVKTLVMADETGAPLIILMHGDARVDLKKAARATGRGRIESCTPADAQRHTGYLVGGTSPFGTRKPMPIYVERSILDLPLLYINGGRRGFLVSLTPGVLVRVLAPTPVEVAR